jgi:hypothetical protein
VNKFTETEIKYLAGLIDADGSLFFNFVKYKDDIWNVRLQLVLQQSLSIDKDGRFLKSLHNKMGMLQQISLSKDNPNWSDAQRWTVASSSDLSMLIPRLVKHMVIKGKHFVRMYEKFLNIYGKSVSTSEKEDLESFAKESRKDVGPVKPKNHPTWAWVAGYLDGDGCYYMRTRKKNWGVQKELLVRVVAHDDDKVSLELLHKAFGGRLRKETNENTHSWTRNLGFGDTQFALHFLRKMVNHSQLKKHKIEQMIHTHLQRLNDITLEGDVIV